MARVSFEAWHELVDVRLRCRRGPDEVEGILQGPGEGPGSQRAWRLRVGPRDYREIRPEDGWDVERLEKTRPRAAPPATPAP